MSDVGSKLRMCVHVIQLNMLHCTICSMSARWLIVEVQQSALVLKVHIYHPRPLGWPHA